MLLLGLFFALGSPSQANWPLSAPSFGTLCAPAYTFNGANACTGIYLETGNSLSINGGSGIDGYSSINIQQDGINFRTNIVDGFGSRSNIGCDQNGLFPFKRSYFGKDGIVIGVDHATTGGCFTPLAMLDVRGGSSSYAQFTTDGTGNASGNGIKFGIDSSGNGVINQQEAKPILFSGNAIRPPLHTTTERDTMTPTEGECLWNSTAHNLQCYDGTTWQNAF